MTPLLIILGLTIVFFIWGKLPPDLVALLAMISLFFTGILTLDEVLSGFSNPTVVMIATLFIVGESLAKTGWTAIAGQYIVRLAGKSAHRLLLITVAGAAGLSGFVSNTGTVATLLPVAVATSWKIGQLPSQFLIPMAFGANTGGLLTLTGTPPNIIANNALLESGHSGFFFFEFALIGMPLLLVALLYFLFFGSRLLPKNKTANKPIDFDSTVHEWLAPYGLEDGYYKMRLRSNSTILGRSLGELELEEHYNVLILHIEKHYSELPFGLSLRPTTETPESMEGLVLGKTLERNDTIIVKGDTHAVNKMMLECRLALIPLEMSEEMLKEDLFSLERGVAEIIVTPRSEYLNKKLRIGEFFENLNLQLLAASNKNRPIEEEEIVIRQGYSFLVRGAWRDIVALEDDKRNFVVCGSTDQISREVRKLNHRSWISLASLVLMISLMVFKVVPGVMAALIAAAIPLLSRCLTPREAYRSISWSSVVLIAAMIPMSIALQNTGAAEEAANFLVNSVGKLGPMYLLASIFLLTTTFSQVINNSATAVLMAPIAIAASVQLGIAPQPSMIMVAVSASTAFLTPIGTTTNVMVFAAGGYSFGDYLKVGALLLLLFFLTCLALVPLIWPM